MENSIQIMEQLLGEDKYKVVVFDLKYTCGRSGYDQKVVLAQLCARHHVLVYHYCLATWHSEHFARVRGSEKKKRKDSLVDLVMDLIDPYYKDMQDACMKNNVAWHCTWVHITDKDHFMYATKDANISYELCMRIVDMRKYCPRTNTPHHKK
ncbi:hypothetical protein D1007_05617 [Hordeum vulgare]|nr:hypothetical protein D1007_05617 [Hordeum vulgare]